MPTKLGNKTIRGNHTKTTNTTKGRQQYREINFFFFKKKKSTRRSCISREPKTKGALEAHRGVGGGRRGAEEADDPGPENKHKKEKIFVYFMSLYFQTSVMGQSNRATMSFYKNERKHRRNIYALI
jgi:hypothetical protein